MIRDLFNLLPFLILMLLCACSVVETIEYIECRVYKWAVTNGLMALFLGTLGVTYLWLSL